METRTGKRGTDMSGTVRRFMIFTADIVIAALLVAGIWGVNYLLPRNGVKAVTGLPAEAGTDGEILTGAGAASGKDASAGNGSAGNSTSGGGSVSGSGGKAGGFQTTNVKKDKTDWHKKFANHFTDQVVTTDTTYTSPDLSVSLTYHTIKTNRLDLSEKGGHKKYGTDISYVLADIYVGDITCLQTCFARDTYGVGFSEKLSGMSARMKSVLAVNGDSYSNNQHKNSGTIIRNGVIYRAQPTDMETCVLNWDGTMKIWQPQELNTQQLIADGAYQSWVFGPSLLDEKGKAKTSFLTWDYIRESHPRTAIGYYEPGHYCLLVADGRQQTTRGMFPDEMASLFEQLGCRVAYNLDGGHCSFMTMGTRVANHPYKPEHEIPDGLFVIDGKGGLS